MTNKYYRNPFLQKYVRRFPFEQIYEKKEQEEMKITQIPKRIKRNFFYFFKKIQLLRFPACIFIEEKEEEKCMGTVFLHRCEKKMKFSKLKRIKNEFRIKKNITHLSNQITMP